MIMKVNDDDRDDLDGDSIPPTSDPALNTPLQRRIDTIQDQLAAPQISRVPVERTQKECVRDDIS